MALDKTTLFSVTLLVITKTLALQRHPRIGGAYRLASAFESPLFSSRSIAQSITPLSLHDAVLSRYACKRFRRYNETHASTYDDSSGQSTVSASQSDPTVVAQALQCINLARRTPTAFNTQPYKVVLVHTPEQKLALSRHCLGPNGDRVRDSDCTAVFLADRRILQTLPRFKRLLDSLRDPSTTIDPMDKARLRRRRWNWFLMQFYITLFSSGYPLPRVLAAIISFGVRTAVGLVNVFTGSFYPMPSLANAETWASKQVMMVAMTYMLSCTSVGLATIPMEGIDARGIRKVVNAPSRYAIPLIVSTGLPYIVAKTPSQHCNETNGLMDFADRYPIDEVVFSDVLGSPVSRALPPSI